MTTGDAIRQMRRRATFTQEKLAELLNTVRPTVSSWENDVFLPGTENVLAMSSIFNCQTDDILKPTAFVQIADSNLCNSPAETTARFTETVDRLLSLSKAIDEPEEITEMVAGLIHNGEANYDTTRQFVQILGEAVGKSILFLRQMAPNTPAATEALEAIEREMFRAA